MLPTGLFRTSPPPVPCSLRSAPAHARSMPNAARHLSAPPAALQLMGKNKVLVKVNPEGKYVVDLGEWHAAELRQPPPLLCARALSSAWKQQRRPCGPRARPAEGRLGGLPSGPAGTLAGRAAALLQQARWARKAAAKQPSDRTELLSATDADTRLNVGPASKRTWLRCRLGAYGPPPARRPCRRRQGH